MSLEYEKIDNKHIRFKNNAFKLNIKMLPILGTLMFLIAPIVILFMFTGNIVFTICAFVATYGLFYLGVNYFRIYKKEKDNKSIN